MSQAELGNIQAELSCDLLTIQGVECFAWAHKPPFPFVGATNTTEFERKLLKNGGGIVSVDGFKASDYYRFDKYAGMDAKDVFANEDVTSLVHTIAESKSQLILGDFKTNLDKNISDKSNTRNALLAMGVGLGVAAGFALEEKFKHKKTMTHGESRRLFLQTGLIAIGGLAMASVLPGIFSTHIAGGINNCEFSDTVIENNAVLDGGSDKYLIARTALTIAKQSRMMAEGIVSGGNAVSLWGYRHLMNPGLISEIKVAASDPSTLANDLVNEDIRLLLSKGYGRDEVVRKVSSMKFDMGGAIPVNVVKMGDGFSFEKVIDKNNGVFFDDRILGFNTKGMSPDKIVKATREVVLDTVLNYI